MFLDLNRDVEVSPKDAALMIASENNAEVLQEGFFIYSSSKKNAKENVGPLLNETAT